MYITENTYWEGFTQRNEQEYLNYKRHGKQFTYTNGKLSLYQEMLDGQEHGLTISYDEDENILEETIYENGSVLLTKIIKE